VYHGFVLSGGRFSAINFPKATLTQPLGINDNGQVVGHYDSADGKRHGFVLSGRTYTSIDFTNATLTSANGINNNGEIVGHYDDSAGITHAFYAVKQ
jgi:probable HAF family extracellular repeat protein